MALFDLHKSLNIHYYHHIKSMMDNIIIEMTNNCNLRCENCLAMLSQKKSINSLTFEQMIKFINIIGKVNKFSQISLNCGGESTIHPDFYKVIEYIETNFERLTLRLNTNLLTLDIKKLSEIIKKNRIIIMPSLMAYDPQTYLRHYGRNMFETWWSKIEDLYKYKSNNLIFYFVHLAKDRELRKKVEIKMRENNLPVTFYNIEEDNSRFQNCQNLNINDNLFIDIALKEKSIPVNVIKYYVDSTKQYVYEKLDLSLGMANHKCVFYNTVILLTAQGNITNCTDSSKNINICHIDNIRTTQEFLKEFFGVSNSSFLMHYELYGYPLSSCAFCTSKHFVDYEENL